MTVHIGQTEIAALEAIGESLVIEAELMKNRGLNVVNVNGILGDTPKGLSLDDLVAKVRASGYKTKAKSFTNVVYQCVYNAKAIYRDKKKGTYRIKPIKEKKKTS